MNKCPDCGEEYTRVAMHWRKGSCSYPELNDFQTEIVKGLVMGDGYVKRRDNSPDQVRAEMTNQVFLQQVYEWLEPLSASVREYRSAEENAGRNNADSAENYQDSYHYNSCTAPTFNQFGEWYSTGEKVWPDDIELTPVSLAILYVCDGTLSSNKPSMSIVKENHRKEYVKSLFQRLDIPVSNSMHHYTLGREEFFNTVGGPIKGFEYKWPDKFINEPSVVEVEYGKL